MEISRFQDSSMNGVSWNVPDNSTLLEFRPELFSDLIDVMFHNDWISFPYVQLQTKFQNIYSQNSAERYKRLQENFALYG